MCIVAEQQTNGRGRHGRAWVSNKNSGLYFSIVLFPEIKREFFPVITLMTSVIVYEALKKIEGLKFKLDIKWSNDVLADEKKICGILAETVSTSSNLGVVVGIGINLTSTDFPAELAGSATSIHKETGKIITIDKLLQSLTKTFDKFYQTIHKPGGHQIILYEWSKRSSYYQNKPVKVNLQNQSFVGITRGLEDNGALRVELPDGQIRIVQAGDVEKLRETHL